MWLLDTTSLALTAFFDDNTPHYAILSHTWGPEEVSFQGIQSPHEAISDWAGYRKIKAFCSKASEAGFRYGWVDTCCIDKTNNAELSEAINSMYRWYANAVTCFAYLADAPYAYGFTNSRWFKRGWTLQELIAPPEVMFFTSFWTEIGSRSSLASEIEKKTRIPAALLMMKSSLKDHCVAEIMSWAADRRTTRAEDRAYSLLGLFGVYMPLLYGEGAHAFIRLQLEIIKSNTDHSIFASNIHDSSTNLDQERGLLTPSIDDFQSSGDVRSLPALDETSFEMTNLGLRITLPCHSAGVDNNGCRNLLAYLNCMFKNAPDRIAIPLKEASGEGGKPLGRFHRYGSLQIWYPPDHHSSEIQPTLLYIIQPTYGHHLRLPRFETPMTCSLDYSNLIKAGYRVERSFGPTGPPWPQSLYKKECKIIFQLDDMSSWSNDPHVMIPPPLWIIIFKHAIRSKRFWVLLGRQADQLLCSIEKGRGGVDPPNSFIDAEIYEWYHKGQSMSPFDYSIEERFENVDSVRLTAQKAVIWNGVGRMMRLTTWY